MNKGQIPDLAITFIARKVKFMQRTEDLFDFWADVYWDRFSRHLDQDFDRLCLALPYKKGC